MKAWIENSGLLSFKPNTAHYEWITKTEWEIERKENCQCVYSAVKAIACKKLNDC